jgi:uncharacterized membrane protein
MRILYLEGDPCAPRIVGAAFRAAGHEVTRPERVEELVPPRDVYVLSDIPADRLGDAGAKSIVASVATGSGLLIVGGWYSLGWGGHAGSPLAAALPVRLEPHDDRVHAPSGLFLAARQPHPILAGLPLGAPPVVTGYNRVEALPDAQVLLEAHAVTKVSAGTATLSVIPVPILVVGHHGAGRVAVLATDLAPRWSGGLPDWGVPRLMAEQGEELGGAYVRFVSQLVGWLGEGRPVAAQRAGVGVGA